MTTIENLQAARVFLAQTYANTAARLAQAVKDDPTLNHWGSFTACSAAWNVLCDIDDNMRAFVFAGDPIDDFHRAGAADAEEGNEP